MAVKLGNALLVTIGSTVLAGQTASSLDVSSNMIDIRAKDSENWKEVLPSVKEASIQIEGLHDPAASAGSGSLDVFALLTAGTLSTIKFGETGTGGKYFTGSGYISNVKLDAPMDDVSTYSATFTFDGAVTVATVGG